MNPTPSAEDLELLQGYLNGTLSDADFSRLQQRLREDQTMRRALRDLATVDAKLQDLAAQAPLLPTIQVSPRLTQPAIIHRRWKSPSPLTLIASAACLAIIAFYAIQYLTLSNTCATVYQGVGVNELSAGSAIKKSRLCQIESGAVELITARGARLVIEAPASFMFKDEQHLYLNRGRISADVPPPAKGFTVITPTGNAIDLGTKFGVDVPSQGPAEIHVFEGEVIAKPKDSKNSHSLRHGEAMTLKSGNGETRELRSAAFILSDELSSLGTKTDERRRRSDAALKTLRNDPTAIVVLDFERDPMPSGTFNLAQGRWPGTRAPEFVNLGDHIRLDAGDNESWPQLTLAAWVRIDRLGSPYQSLYHTDGWDQDKPGQLHWMITQDTTMRLAQRQTMVEPPFSTKSNFPDSLRPVLPDQGRWMHLLVVNDSDKATTRFYVNGELDNEVRLAKALPALLGPAQIGNWNQHDRRLSGRVDEFILMGRALSDHEIRELHAAGNPYR